MNLSRAAFAVLLKFTDNVKEFEALIEDAEKIRQEEANNDDLNDEQIN